MRIERVSEGCCLAEVGQRPGQFGTVYDWCKQPAIIVVDLGGGDEVTPLCTLHAIELLDRLATVLREPTA
jgi:hypothetical protein